MFGRGPATSWPETGHEREMDHQARPVRLVCQGRNAALLTMWFRPATRDTTISFLRCDQLAFRRFPRVQSERPHDQGARVRFSVFAISMS